MFSRFLPRIREHCGRLTFACQKPLLSLIKHSFPQIDVVAGDESVADFDVHLPLLSLEDRLGLHTESEFQSEPYLFTDKNAALPNNGKPKVGVAWQEIPTTNPMVSRSIPWEQFKTVVELDGIDFYNLQVGPRASDCGGGLIRSQQDHRLQRHGGNRQRTGPRHHRRHRRGSSRCRAWQANMDSDCRPAGLALDDGA